MKGYFSLLIFCCITINTKYLNFSQAEQQSVSALEVKMGHTLLRMLALFLLSTLLYGQDEGQNEEEDGHAEYSDVEDGPTGGDAVLESPASAVFEGDSVTMRCRHRNQQNKMKAAFFKDGSPLVIDTNHQSRGAKMTIYSVSESDEGTYTCGFEDGAKSEAKDLRVEGGDAVLETPAFAVFEGESVTMRCRHHNRRNKMEAAFFKDGSRVENHQSQGAEMTIYSVSKSDEGTYTCEFDDGAESEAKDLRVKAYRRRVTLRADKTTIPVGGHVTLTCDVEDATGLSMGQNLWVRYSSDSLEEPVDIENGYQYDISHGGKYTCQGWRREPAFFTSQSSAVIVHETVSNKATVTLHPDWPQIFSGEKMTLRCEIQGGGDTGWTYEWSTPRGYARPTGKDYIISSATGYHSGEYRCMGRRDLYFLTQWSDVITLKVLSYRPQARLSAVNRDIPVGGSVTLTCSVSRSSSSSSSSWKYFWYRGEKTSELLASPDVVFLSNGQIRVSQGGLYWCRGGRGDPVYYTEYSDSVYINNILTNTAVVTLHPNWPEIYSGEMITLTCEIKNRGDNEWGYEWKHRSKPLQKQSDHMTRSASSSHSGDYKCRGRVRGEMSSTEWSDAFRLSVSSKPLPVLTVSPLWLSHGASVTLNCSVEHPSAGWRFFWYKAVPKLSDTSYSYELIPGSINGTEQDSYIVDGQTHTAGYVCSAGRGDPVYYTYYSEPKFVWSGDVHSSASLTVSPDRVQHFTADTVSLTCEGNSTDWRVKLTESGSILFCQNWGTMTGSTCSIEHYLPSAVYWCESGSGEFSNAVNITISSRDIILVSPVHPVTEGDAVSLSCKLRGQSSSKVFFYRNDKLLQNDTRRELNISAVSKSDEGFYKCESSAGVSAQSWMSVKGASRSESSSFPVPVIIGLVFGIVLVILLLLLYRYRRSKDSCFIRPVQSESTSRGSAAGHMVNQNEAQQNEDPSPLHDTAESQDVTYSSIELKNFGRKGNCHEPEESCLYSVVKMGTADDSVTYAQVTPRNKGKAKKNKGKSTVPATDEAVYSEVKPGTALGL